MLEIDNGELARLVESDWAIKRLRTRLLAYRLSLRDAAQDRRRRREAAFRAARGDKAAKALAMEIDVKLPSWMPVIDDIYVSEAAQLFLERPPRSEAAEEQSAKCQADEEEEDVFLRLSDDQLRQFIEGVPAGEDNLHYIHYTTPDQPHIMQAIGAFLIEKGFLTAADLTQPHTAEIPKEVKDELQAVGLARDFIPQDRNFRGDYTACSDTDGDLTAAMVTFHTDSGDMAYVARYVETVFTRRSTDTTSSFENRIRQNKPASRNELTGWAYYELGQPFVVVLQDPLEPEPEFHFAHVPTVLIGPGIDDPVPVRGSAPPKKDISIRLAGLAEKFVWVKLGPNQTLSDERLSLMSAHQEEATFATAANKMKTSSDYLLFSITYEKSLALLRRNEL